MTAALGAAKGARPPTRLGDRAPDPRTRVTRVGKLALWVPQDRAGRLLDRAVRARSARGGGARGGARREVRAGRVDAHGQGDAEAQCGHRCSAAATSAITARLAEDLAAGARRRLDEPYVVRIFAKAPSGLRLSRARAAPRHENCLAAHRSLAMADLPEHKQEVLPMAA